MNRTSNIVKASKWHMPAPIFGLGLYGSLCDADNSLSS